MTSRTTPASVRPATVRRMLRRFVAVGMWAPWKGTASASAEVTESEVVDIWVGACRARGVTEEELDDAVVGYANTATQQTRWPTPGDVLPQQGSVRKAAAAIQGCGRCSPDVGWREVAVHRRDKQDRLVVDVYVAACDCALGEHWRLRRAEPLRRGEPPRRPGLGVQEFRASIERQIIAAMQGQYGGRDAPPVAVYVDPTPEQRTARVVVARPATTARPGTAARLGEQLAGAWSGGAPEQRRAPETDRPRYRDWTEAPDQDEFEGGYRSDGD